MKESLKCKDIVQVFHSAGNVKSYVNLFCVTRQMEREILLNPNFFVILLTNMFKRILMWIHIKSDET